VDVRQLKEALWHRIKQLGKTQQQSPAAHQPPADVKLRFQVQRLTAAVLLPADLHHSYVHMFMATYGPHKHKHLVQVSRSGCR
jgi:hypothetical protein